MRSGSVLLIDRRTGGNPTLNQEAFATAEGPWFKLPAGNLRMRAEAALARATSTSIGGRPISALFAARRQR
jgi:hypothetical protein